MKVLLIEDGFLTGLAIRRGLEAIDAEVIGPVPDLRSGLARARSEHFDLAVLDIRIQGGTSVAIAEALVERTCPVLFVTGYSDDEVLPEALRDAPQISKPVSVPKLHAAIAALIETGNDTAACS